MKNFKLLITFLTVVISFNAKGQFKCGFIDKTGKVVIPAQFENANSFSQGLAAVLINGKWGFIDKTGKIVIQPIYEYALDFKKYDNQIAARVLINGENKIINELGILIVEPLIKINANELRPFSLGGYLNGYKDINGKIVVPEIYSLAQAFEGGYGIVFDMEKGGGLIDVSGKLVMPLTPEFLPIYSEGVFIIKRNGIHEIVNEQLKTLIILDKIPNLQQCENFKNGLAPIKVNDKWGLMNKKGEIVLLPQYENCITFYDGVAKAKKDGIIGLINTKGEPIGNVRDKEYWGFSEGLSVYTPMNQPGRQYQGFIDKTGAVVMPVQYSMLENFSEGLAKFEIDSKNLNVALATSVVENSIAGNSNDEINAITFKKDLKIIIEDATTAFQKSKAGFDKEQWEGKYYNSNNSIFKSDDARIVYMEAKNLKYGDDMPEEFYFLQRFSTESKEGVFLSKNIETIFNELAIEMNLKIVKVKMEKKYRDTNKRIVYYNQKKEKVLEFHEYSTGIQIKVFSDLRPVDLPKYQGCLLVYNFQSGKVVGVSINYVYGPTRPDPEKLYYIMKPKIENQYTHYDKFEYTYRDRNQMDDFLAPFGNIQKIEKKITPDGNTFFDN